MSEKDTDGRKRRTFLKLTGGTLVAGSGGLAGCLGGGGGTGDGDGDGDGDGGTATSTPTSTMPDNLHVGLIMPQSGAYGFLGTDFNLGFELRMEQINASSELLPDTQMTATKADTESAPDAAIKAAERLVLQDEVDLLVGGAHSEAAASIAQFASQENVPFFVGQATDKSITTGKNCKFTTARIAGTTEVNPKILNTYAVKEMGLKRGYSLLPDYSIGYQMQEIVPSVVEANGGEIVKESLAPAGNQDWATFINDIQSVDPDYLFVGVAGSGLIPFLTQAVNAGLQVPIFVNFFMSPTAGALTQQQIEDLPGLFRAAYYTREIDTPENQAFVESFQESEGRPPIMPNGMGHMNANLVARVVQAAGTKETEAVMTAVEGYTWNDLVGEIRMRECDHQGLPPIHLTKYTGVEGKLGTSEILKRYTADDLDGTFVTPCSEAGCSFDN